MRKAGLLTCMPLLLLTPGLHAQNKGKPLWNCVGKGPQGRLEREFFETSVKSKVEAWFVLNGSEVEVFFPWNPGSARTYADMMVLDCRKDSKGLCRLLYRGNSIGTIITDGKVVSDIDALCGNGIQDVNFRFKDGSSMIKSMEPPKSRPKKPIAQR